MYDKEYARSWIKNNESGKDYYRTKYIEPKLKEFIKSISNEKSIIDIGCGWGTIIPFLKKHKYVGIDPVDEFFPYIKKKAGKNINLVKGGLPKNIGIKDKFDVVICSMVLHTIKDLKGSIKKLKELINSSGKMLIIEFRDDSEDALRKSFIEVYGSSNKHVSGRVRLASGIIVESDVFFHKEEEIENLLKGYEIKKEYFGELYVKYEILSITNFKRKETNQ